MGYRVRGCFGRAELYTPGTDSRAASWPGYIVNVAGRSRESFVVGEHNESSELTFPAREHFGSGAE
ncbi:predicted protein [Botrytis cinerea T4]|uniref:Uncharacterized protein n=1 Tax=Botryotinia fuckeliana (strain T4) TaxID=999810 RepID=G2YSI0_BOTF4|nr:predicted protein [Botrytis cinerea T4]